MQFSLKNHGSRCYNCGMSKKEETRSELLGIASLLYAIFFTCVLINPRGQFVNAILEKVYEIQPLKEGWFIGITVLLYFLSVFFGFVYFLVLIDRFKK